MKTTSFLAVVLFVCSSFIPQFSFAQTLSPDQVVGRWKVISLNGEEVPGGATMEFVFNNEGKMKMLANAVEMMEASWRFSEDKTGIVLNTEDMGDRNWGVKVPAKDELVIIDNNEEMVLNRVNEESPISDSPVTIKADAKKLVGTWEVTTFNGQPLPGDAAITLYIKKDGTIKMDSGQEVSEDGKWELSEDKKSLLVLKESGSNETWGITELSKSTLGFLADGLQIKLKRK